MKTLFKIVRNHTLHYRQINDILTSLHLQDFRPMKASTILGRLYPLTLDPNYGYMLEALGINGVVKPNEMPLFRLATIEDFVEYAQTEALREFLMGQHLFSCMNAKFATQGDLIMAFNAVHRDILEAHMASLAKDLEIIQNVAATAYYNNAGTNPVVHRDRIIWAREILRPINCVQIAIQGQFGHPYNDPIGPLETEVLKAVTSISAIMNSPMFQLVGSENLSFTKHHTPHGTEVYLTFEFPNRKSYGTFVIVHPFHAAGTVRTLNAREKSMLGGIDSDCLVDVKGWCEHAKRLRIAERRATGTITLGDISRRLIDVMPDLTIETTYLPLLIAALFDLVEWSWHNDIDAIPTINDGSITDLINRVDVFYNVVNPAVVTPADVRDFLMLDAGNTGTAAALSANEIERFNAYHDYLGGIDDLMRNRIAGQEFPSVACDVDKSIDMNILLTLGLPTSLQHYRLGVIANPSASPLTFLTGVLYTLGTWFMVETDFTPNQKMDFPRSSFWQGDGLYEDNGFTNIGTAATLRNEYAYFAGFMIPCPVCMEDATRYVNDIHLTTMLQAKLADLNRLYTSLTENASREEIRWAIIMNLVEMGDRIRREVGRMPIAIGNWRDVQIAQRLSAIAYAIWYMDVILNNDHAHTVSTTYAFFNDIHIDDVIRTMVTAVHE